MNVCRRPVLAPALPLAFAAPAASRLNGARSVVAAAETGTCPVRWTARRTG